MSVVCTLMHEFGHACICRYLQSSDVNITIFLNNSPPYRPRQSPHLVLVKCWQANSLWETSLLLPRHWCSGRAAKPTWMSVWAPRPSGIMLACQVLFPPTHISSPLLSLMCLVGWLVASSLCVHICVHVPCDAHVEVRKQLGSWRF